MFITLAVKNYQCVQRMPKLPSPTSYQTTTDEHRGGAVSLEQLTPLSPQPTSSKISFPGRRRHNSCGGGGGNVYESSKSTWKGLMPVVVPEDGLSSSYGGSSRNNLLRRRNARDFRPNEATSSSMTAGKQKTSK